MSAHSPDSFVAGAKDNPETQSPNNARRELLVFSLFCLLAAVPLWISRYPPMADLPQHAAQLALLRNLHRPGFAFASLYRVNWFTPYLFGYMLVYVLLPFVNALTAVKLVLSAALVAFPITTALVMRQTGASLRWAYLTIPCLYGVAYAWGMLNYIVAAPLGMALLCFAIVQSRRPSWRTALGLAVCSILLFFCHALICALFIGVSAGFVAFEKSRWTQKLLGLAPLAAALPIMALWAHHRTQTDPDIQSSITTWDLGWFQSTDFYYSQHPGWGRLTGFMPRILGESPSWTASLFGLLLFMLPLIAGSRPSRRPGVWVPFVTCFLLLFLAPGFVSGTAFVYQRFAMFALPFFLLAMGAPSTTGTRFRVSTILAPCFALMMIVMVATQAWIFSLQCQGFDELLAHMRPGQRALGMMYESDSSSNSTIAPPFLHFAQWYSALKDGAVDPGFAAFFPEIVYYAPEQLPPASVLRAFDWYPSQFRWELYNGESYRYFVVRARVDVAQYAFAAATCPITLRFHQGRWWLYERGEPCTDSAQPPNPASSR